MIIKSIFGAVGLYEEDNKLFLYIPKTMCGHRYIRFRRKYKSLIDRYKQEHQITIIVKPVITEVNNVI